MKNQIFTRKQVVKIIESILEAPDIIRGAIDNEDTDYDGEELLRLAIDDFYAIGSNETKTGVELIAEERREQIEKHGRTVIKDVALNSKPTGPFTILPLIIGATNMIGAIGGIPWPKDWDKAVCEKMESKTRKEKLAIAGAFIAAEIDRLIAIEDD